jgi:hypothetical protein
LRVEKSVEGSQPITGGVTLESLTVLTEQKT